VSALVPTPGQTVGPFFGYALPYPGDAELVPLGTPGAIPLRGRVLDGRGQPVPDAMLELWQAGPDGSVVQHPGSLRRDGWTFTGWGRASTDNEGRYSFTTLAPGTVPGSTAPFFALTVFARGLLDRLFTRAYLPVDDETLDRNPLLAAVPRERRDSLIASRAGSEYVFDVVLQGDGETVFLNYAGEPTR
jgi:protocatechuate 3,4-dioxygenase alpha subunit